MKTIVKLNQVSVTFKKKKALANLDCELFAGEVVGLVGPNGAGKTTLMKTILGLVPASQGSIIGQEQKMASLIEQPGLYPFMTGLEHLELFSDQSCNQLEIDQLIQLLDLTEFINQKTKDYSLGMKQRLGIALALLNKPQLVILDEPMNGLDPYSVKLLKEAILIYRKAGISFLISSHILSELEQIVDRVLLVKAGELVENVEHPELLNDFEEGLLAKLA
ncbi:ABC transporter ATP-binding protein [Enterococcus sp. HY326]|uniref:ABC transporter ATP-binding protein n=1 Tax=Enterococcus sp. HY326 TaxID=2971265 RepID=UPI0022401E2D|nr:ATP-binding cassette domain-containing protein [Enterococcus sp. HY326]